MSQISCLLDENIDVRLTQVLKLLGLAVERVPSGSSDGAVFAVAKKSRAILLTNDKDFANALLYPPAQTGGIVVFDVHPPTLANLSSAINRLVAHRKPAELAGKLCIISSQAIVLSS